MIDLATLPFWLQHAFFVCSFLKQAGVNHVGFAFSPVFKEDAEKASGPRCGCSLLVLAAPDLAVGETFLVVANMRSDIEHLDYTACEEGKEAWLNASVEEQEALMARFKHCEQTAIQYVNESLAKLGQKEQAPA